MPRYDDDDDDDRPYRRRRNRDIDDDDSDETASDSAPGNGFAVTSMILGIVGFCVPLICGLLAILFGFLGLKRSKQTGTGKGMAITGLILGVINGIIIPIVGGYLIYRGVVVARRETLKAAQKAEDDWKETVRKMEEDSRARQKQREEELKEWNKKNEEDNKKREEERAKQDTDFKERMAQQAEERKKQDAERKLNSDVVKAKGDCLRLEIACRNYMGRNKGVPPASLRDLLTPPNGGIPFIAESALTDPWGKRYQYDATAKTTDGKTDPFVFTVHPENGDQIRSARKAVK